MVECGSKGSLRRRGRFAPAGGGRTLRCCAERLRDCLFSATGSLRSGRGGRTLRSGRRPRTCEERQRDCSFAAPGSLRSRQEMGGGCAALGLGAAQLARSGLCNRVNGVIGVCRIFHRGWKEELSDTDQKCVKCDKKDIASKQRKSQQDSIHCKFVMWSNFIMTRYSALQMWSNLSLIHMIIAPYDM